VYEVLIAEDEELEREAVCSIISKDRPDSVILHRAANGVEALGLARTRELDAAFLDIRMPGLDGLEAAREIRLIKPGLPIVFLTACDCFEYARKAVSLGIDDYLLKPAENAEILGALDRMLEARKTELERTDALKSTAAYLRGEIEKGLSAGRLDERCLSEYLKAAASSAQAFFLAAFRLPKEKSQAMSAGFRRALLSRIVARAGESCAARGLSCVGAASFEHAFVLCLGEDGLDADAASETAKAVVEEAQRRAMGDFGASPHAGIAFGPVGGLVEAARSAADLSRNARAIVSMGGGEPANDGASNRLAERALAFMAEGLSRDISLDETAARLRVSPSHLSRILSAGDGPGFSGVLAKLRVQKAEAFLLGGASVKEAAALVGFKDPAYFARVFRRHSGMSPTEFLGRGGKE
jgi:two-component system, response regulator YesN